MSNWDRREALALVAAIEKTMKVMPIAAAERQGLWEVTQKAKRASETCSTDAHRMQSIRQSLCKVCVSGRINGCGPVNAGTSNCFWLAGELSESDSLHRNLAH